jgi:hypothetical protein
LQFPAPAHRPGAATPRRARACNAHDRQPSRPRPPDVLQFLPENTRSFIHTGVQGWVYDIQNDLSDWYRMFLYFNPRTSLYYVRMVDPAVPERVDPHVAHYFHTGDLCLTKDVGTRTLRDAYTRSVAFSIGWSYWQRYHVWPFDPSPA